MMRQRFRLVLVRLGLLDRVRQLRGKVLPGLSKMEFPPYSDVLRGAIEASGDPVRYTALALALETVRQGVPGSLAEVGVYKGDLSHFIHWALPDRKLYLFDTFEGFPEDDLEVDADERFRDTSLLYVKERVGGAENVIFRPGYFPDTVDGLEDERFAFVMLDLDLFAPTIAGLEFFYPRLEPGGFLVLHDYNNPESDFAVSRAADKFFADKPEYLVAIPDRWGSVVIRKVS